MLYVPSCMFGVVHTNAKNKDRYSLTESTKEEETEAGNYNVE